MGSDAYIAALVEAAAERKERTELRNRRLREAALREVKQVEAVWHIDQRVTQSTYLLNPKVQHVELQVDVLAGVTGTCTRCKREFPAIGLVAVDQRVPIRGEHVWRAPTNDDPLGGRWVQAMRHIIGWFCAGCRPRNFGRIPTGTGLGRKMETVSWVELPTDGSPIDPPNQDKVGLLKPLGQAGDGPRRAVKHRNRKPKPMKPLGS